MRDSTDVRNDLSRITFNFDSVELQKLFGNRFSRAWEIMKERKVNKYIFLPSGRVVWTVFGNHGEYLILPAAAYCSCSDFFFPVVSGEANACLHLIAQRLAALSLDFNVIRYDDSQYSILSDTLKGQ